MAGRLASAVLSVLLLYACIQAVAAQTCVNLCPQTAPNGEWASQLGVVMTEPRAVTLNWLQDNVLNFTEYVVRYRERMTGETFNASAQTTELSLRVGNLKPSTDYEAEVCRANTVDTVDSCGNCLFCFSTTVPDEPSSPPVNLQARANGPANLLLSWEEPLETNGGIRNYSLLCVEAATGMLASPGANKTGLVCSPCSEAVLGLSPETSYNCSVVALNDHGQSLPAVEVARTPTRDVEAGVLLLVYSDRVEYSELTESRVTATNIIRGSPILFTTGNTILGIDYHFSRQELYLSYQNGSLVRRSLTTTTGDSITLSASPDEVGLYTAGAGVVLGSVTVDWVEDELYWIESQATSSTIMRAVLSPSGLAEVYCVVAFPSTTVPHIVVDATRGFFYWNVRSEGLYRTDLASVRTTTTLAQCASQVAGQQLIANNSILETFTLEPNEALYFVGQFECTNPNRPQSLFSVSLNAERTQGLRSFSLSSVNGLASFTGFVLLPVPPANFATVANSAEVCSSTVPGIALSDTTGTITLLRTYRSSQQPLPVPPSFPDSVRVLASASSAAITWNAPQFIEGFFSASAFRDWTYVVSYTSLQSNSISLEANTTATSLTLAQLQPSSLYQFTLTAVGPGGEVPNPANFTFSTLALNGSSDRLLVATEAGVIMTTLTGQGPQLIDAERSAEANGVTYDSYDEVFYWAIAGGQSNLFTASSPTEPASVLYSSLRNPSALKLDWVSRRLFWVETGGLSSRIRSATPEQPLLPFSDFALVDNIQETTAMDARNGLLFWTAEDVIYMKTLSDVVLPPCLLVLPAQPTALAVDVRRQLLYWLATSPDDTVVVSQVSYSLSGCDNTSIVAVSLKEITLSPSVLAYASNTLFIGSLRSNRVYSIASSLPSLLGETEPAVGSLTFETLVRDIAVISTTEQPLPDGLEPSQRGLAALVPARPGAPRLRPGVTPPTAIVEWAASPSPSSASAAVFYRLDYSLRLLNGSEQDGLSITSETTSVMLTLEPFTELTGTVTSFSLWQSSQPSETGRFTTPPALPQQVQNVRGFIYQPQREGAELSALIVWDPLMGVASGGFVQNYIISVFEQGGSELPDVYVPPTNATTYSVQQRSNVNAISYILQPGTTYDVEVQGSNPTGPGPASVRVTIAASYPQQVLRAGPAGVGVAGEAPVGPVPGVSSPVAADSLARELYWYDEPTSSIFRMSLDGGSTEVFISTPQDTATLALFFDWVGQQLYYALRENSTGRLLVMSVPAANKNGVQTVFPQLEDAVSEQLRLVVDPFTGFLYYVTSGPGGSSLHRLDLRQPDSDTSTLLSGPSIKRRRRRRRQASMTDLSSLSLTPALALDPHTGALYVSDITTGHIYACNVTTTLCTVAVNRTEVNMPATLPASGIVLDVLRLYWTSSSQPGVFAVDLADPATVLVVSGEETTDVLSLNPQQSPLPSQDCLSPLQIFPDSLMGRPQPVLVERTSMGLVFNWTAPTLHVSCASQVFSFPPLSYDVVIDFAMETLEGYPQTTFDTVFVATGLEPFSIFEVQIRTSNQYTQRLNAGDMIGGQKGRFNTTTGVPEPAIIEGQTVYGTRSANIAWQRPIFFGDNNTLNGAELDLQYFVSVGGSDVQLVLEETLNLTELQPGTGNNVSVVISNIEFNSSATVQVVQPWALPPIPTLTNSTNTSLTFEVQLNSLLHFPLEEIGLMVCPVNASGLCNCSLQEGEPSADFRSVDPLMNETVSFLAFTGLESFTDYCAMTVGRYMLVPDFTVEREEAVSVMTTFTTGAGVPDAPLVQLDRAILSWQPPNDRGKPILSYRAIARRTGASTVTEPVEMDLVASVTDLDLNTWTALVVNEPYDIKLHAVNEIGESAASNDVEPFSRVINSEFGIGATIGVVIGGVVIVALVLCFIFVCVWCCTQRPTKRELQLSYMYGPDHELSNLRDAYRHQHANNPHYTWNRDDYVCSDDDLEQLSKFPRQNLKLEDFIDRGEFGEVYQGTATDILGPETGQTPVAVKTLRKGSTIDEQKKFLSEAALMGNFNHPNIVKVLGVCIDNDPVYIIMELMPAGDLLKFLREAKRDHGPALLTLQEQIKVAVDVAQGCRYLEQQHFIHRDIAARNCLVSSKGADRVVKIGDFGLAKDLYSSDYYQVEGQRKLPVRWMSPEALLQGKFTIESDIWSYGVLLWEILSLGNQPYPGRTNQEVLQYVTGGGRLDRPEKCPGRIYHLMQNCWKPYGSDRQHFQQIMTTLTNFMEHLNRRPDSVYYGNNDSDSEDGGEQLQRQSSGKTPARTPSFRNGIMNLARSGSMKLRNSLRRHGSVHKRDEHSVSQFSVSSSENLIAASDDGAAFRERGPF